MSHHQLTHPLILRIVWPVQVRSAVAHTAAAAGAGIVEINFDLADLQVGMAHQHMHMASLHCA